MMLGPPTGIAHVSFRGGSLCMPARSPYDRELLADEVLREAHSHDTVQLLFDGDCWLVRNVGWHNRVRCNRCGLPTSCICSADGRGDAMRCIGCAVGKPPAAHLHSALRAA